MDDWRIACELAYRLGDDTDLESVDEVTDELVSVAPALAGGSAALFAAARDGVRIPVRAHADDIVVRTGALSILVEGDAAVSWEPIRVDGAALDPADSAADPAADSPAADEQTGDDETGDDEAGDPNDATHAAAQPEVSLLSWDGAVDAVSVPGRDAYALRIVSNPSLYDHGSAVRHSASIAALVRPATLLLAPADIQRLGVPNGTEVRVTSSQGSFAIAVEGRRGIVDGTAVLAAGGELGANELIDAGAPVTDVRVETIR
jgi:anaerobic selenocysteine-containing dehydrogenase